MSDTPEDRTVSFKLKNGMPYYAAVGQAASTWAFLENRVDLAILSFSKDHDVLACLLAQMFSIHAKIDALIAVCHTRGVSEETMRKLQKFSQEIRPLTLRRNRIIHDPIMDDEAGKKMVLRLHTKAAKGKLEFGLTPFDLDEIGQFIRHVTDRADDFQKIRVAIESERKPTGEAAKEP